MGPTSTTCSTKRMCWIARSNISKDGICPNVGEYQGKIWVGSPPPCIDNVTDRLRFADACKKWDNQVADLRDDMELTRVAFNGRAVRLVGIDAAVRSCASSAGCPS